MVTNPTVRIDTYETYITGELSGGQIVYSQTWNEPFGGAGPQAGVNTARLAITDAGGPGIVITGPTLVEHTETLIDSDTVTQTETTTTQTLVGEETIGPGTIIIGDLGLCQTSAAGPGQRPTDCENPGTPLTIGFNDTNYNSHTNTHYDITETHTTTEEWLTYEHWTLVGQVQAVGVVHTSVQSAAFDATARFLRRLGDQAAGRPGVIAQGDGEGGFDLARFVWLEGYGTVARTDADGAIPGDRRTSAGLAGGLTLPVSDNFVLGLGIDHGRTSIDLDSAFAESGTVDLAEFGVNGGYRSGPFFVNLAGTFGFGNADTTHALGGVSTASYDISTWGVLAETGYRFDLGAVRVTPSFGLDYINVRTDGFAETGGAALVAPAHSMDRSRAWLGLDVGHTWHTASGGSFDLSGYGRVVGVLSGEERVLPVAFASAPGAGMTVTGNAEDRIGFDLGAKASYDFGNGASLFAAYDGRFRDGFDAHSGRIGFKVTW